MSDAAQAPAEKNRTVRKVGPDEFRQIATEEGWQKKTIDLYLRRDIVRGKVVSVSTPVPCGKFDLILIQE